jgi:hypothetical protein
MKTYQLINYKETEFKADDGTNVEYAKIRVLDVESQDVLDLKVSKREINADEVREMGMGQKVSLTIVPGYEGIATVTYVNKA